MLINSPKIPYSNSGINQIRSSVESTLNRYVSTGTRPNILQEDNPYTTSFPSVLDVSFNNVANRVYAANFTAYLAGAIHVVQITGTLTYSAQQ